MHKYGVYIQIKSDYYANLFVHFFEQQVHNEGFPSIHTLVIFWSLKILIG